MKQFILQALVYLYSASVFADNDELRFRAEQQIYKNRCQRGDYAVSKAEEWSDIKRINDIGIAIGQAQFVGNCKYIGVSSESKMFSGGGYVPSESEKSPLITRNLIKVDDELSYDSNSIEHFGGILRFWLYGDTANPKVSFFEDGEQRFIYSSKTQVDINCINRTYQLLDGSIYVQSSFGGKPYPKLVASRATQIESGSAIEKIYFMACPSPVAKAIGLQAPDGVSIANPLPASNNCELAKAQAYLTPVPSGSFAESQRYADSAYASCMANLPIPAPPVASTPIAPPSSNGMNRYLKGHWVENGKQMCKYDDGSVINIGIGICPLSY